MTNVLEDLHRLQGHAQRVTECLHNAVVRHAIVKTTRDKRSLETLTHDFRWFVTSKAARTFDAADRLVTMSFGEDALVLLRTAYEAYLHLSFVAENPDRINDLVAAKVGAHAGWYVHPTSRKGKRVWSKIISPETGNASPHGVPIPELVALGRHPEDRQIHPALYAFLSEHAHVHMVGVGAYRTPDGSQFYSEPSLESMYSAILVFAYLVWLIGSEVRHLVGSARPTVTKKALGGVGARLRRSLHGAAWAEPLSQMPEQMLARLTAA